MRNPRENLGDYATIIEDLHLYDVDKQKMYDDIRQSGADDAAFRQRLEGGLIAAVISAVVAASALAGSAVTDDDRMDVRITEVAMTVIFAIS